MTLTNLRKGEEGISRERGGAGRERKRKQEKWEKNWMKLVEVNRREEAEGKRREKTKQTGEECCIFFMNKKIKVKDRKPPFNLMCFRLL